MKEIRLIRPRPDGFFEFTQVDWEQISAETIKSQNWQRIEIDALSEWAQEDRESPIQIVIPDELCYRIKFVPILRLNRGGWKWLRKLRKALGDKKVSWTVEKALGQLFSPLPIPLLANPNTRGIKTLILTACIAAGGVGLQEYASVELDKVNKEYESLGRRIEELRDLSVQITNTDHIPTTPLGPLDTIQTLSGWSSWLAVNVLRSGAQYGTIVRFSANWDPPLDLAHLGLPHNLDWQLQLRDISAAGLYRLYQRLQESGLGAELLQLQGSQERLINAPGQLPIIIRGKYSLDIQKLSEDLR